MPVPLLYIYINRPGERGGGRCLPPFLGKGGSLEKFMQVILQSNSVELSGVGHFNSLPSRITLSRGNLIENGNIVLYYLICNASKIAQKTQNTKKIISKRVSGGFIF